MSNQSLHDDCGRRGMKTVGGVGNRACIDVGRVFDSCSDRDCLEDLRLYFSRDDQNVIDCASCVRAKKAEILGTLIDVEALPFQEGRYSCTITFFAQVQLEVYKDCDCACDVLCGCTVFEKRVVLCGGEGAAQLFCSDADQNGCLCRSMNKEATPRCCVQVAEPVVLEARLVDTCGCACGGMKRFPESIVEAYGGCLAEDGGKTVSVTLGVFSIVRLIRQTQLVIPVLDYGVPCKECSCDEATACDVFRKMCFPLEEFYPSCCNTPHKK